MRLGGGVRARSQGGPQGGQWGQSRGVGPWLGRAAGPRGRSGCLLIAVCMVVRLRRGAPGVQRVPWGPPCPPLQDVVKVLPWVVDGARGLGAGKTSGAGTRGVDLNAAVGGRTGYTDTNGGESSNNGSKIHADLLIVIRQKIPVYEEN